MVTIGFRKNSQKVIYIYIYVILKKLIIKIKFRANWASPGLTRMGCKPIQARPIGSNSNLDANFIARLFKISAGPSGSTHIPSSSFKSKNIVLKAMFLAMLEKLKRRDL